MPPILLYRPALLGLLLTSVLTLADDMARGYDPSATHPDPTNGAIVLMDGRLSRPADTAAAQWPVGKHLAGRHFKAGSGWWALACQNTCTLTATQLSLRALKHPTYDGPSMPGQYLSWSPLPYQLDQPDAATAANAVLLALFKPKPAQVALKLAPGLVKTWLHQGMDAYPVSQKKGTGSETVRIKLDKGMAAIVPILADEPERHGETNQPTESRLELRAYGRKQNLGEVTFGIDGGMPLLAKSYLHWAGDLDGDGRLDLLLDQDQARGKLVLYLSSLAQAGELVGEAGAFNYIAPDDPGC
ncbi:hypothetical protein [Chitinimonas sp. JJ19]|uniref:hypothetical protein n=1 Tax=Chitinimonas sp. JJ19 TaxID=3109352 RepID=UPI0030017823